MPGENQAGRTTSHVGFVSQIDPTKHRAKVNIPDLGVESYWLEVDTLAAGGNQFYSMPDVGDCVRAELDEEGINGRIHGGCYNGQNSPPVSSPDKVHFKVKDGSTFEYDRSSHTLNLNLQGPATIVLNNNGGASITISPDGSIDITCKNFSLNCTGTLSLNAASSMTVQASNISNSAGQIANNVASFTLSGKEAASIDAPDNAGQLLVGRGW